jgi:hypothetical protein
MRLVWKPEAEEFVLSAAARLVPPLSKDLVGEKLVEAFPQLCRPFLPEVTRDAPQAYLGK